MTEVNLAKGMVSQPQVRNVDQLRSLNGVKWSRHEPPLLPAWVADMDLAPPQFVVDALVDFANSRDYGYNFAASQKLAPAFGQWQADFHGWNPNLDRVKTFCDVLHAIDVAIWLHTDPGDGVVLLTPVYPPFIEAVTSVDRRIIDVPLIADDGWRLDPERMDEAIDERTTVLLLCNPHNPTGRVFDAAERQAIAEIVLKHDLLLISDEVWADLTHPGFQHQPMVLIPELADRTVTVTSASKSFNLAGLRCAVAHFGHEGLFKMIEALPQHFLGAVSIPGATASLHCWTEGHDWLGSTRTFLTARRNQLMTRLADELPDAVCLAPDATYLAWLDMRRFELDPSPSKWLIDNAAVVLNQGTDFGRHGEGFVRLNFATSEEILDEILDRVVAALH